MNMSLRVPILINGNMINSKTASWIPVVNPATSVLAEAPNSTPDEVDAAVAAKLAFASWKETPVSERVLNDALSGAAARKYQHNIKW